MDRPPDSDRQYASDTIWTRGGVPIEQLPDPFAPEPPVPEPSVEPR